MTDDVAATLDALSQAPEPAWLWDPERMRVAWANEAGCAFWGAGTPFDLVERRFPPTDTGIARLGDFSRQLGNGETTRAHLAFSGATVERAIEWNCRYHPLNDGRAGLLVVATLALDAARAPDPSVSHGILDTLPSPIVILSGSGDVLHCNAAARDLWTYATPGSLKEIIGSAETAGGFLRQAKAAGLVSQIVDIKTRFGSRPHRINMEPEPAGGDIEQRYVLQLDDVADRRSLEQELRAHADRLADFAAAASTVTWELDEALCFSSADGDVPGDPVGTSWAEFAELHNIDPGGAIARALENRDAWRTAVEWPAAQGTVALYLSAVPHFDASGRFAGYRGIGAPIVAPDSHPTPVTAAEAKLDKEAAARLSAEDHAAFRHIAETLTNGEPAAEADAEAEPTRQPGPAVPSDQDLRTILDTATDGVLTLDHQGRIASINSSAQAIFGFDSQEAVGRSFYDLVTTSSAATVRDYLAALTDSGLARIFNDGREIVGVERQGGEIPLFVTIGRIYTEGDDRDATPKYCAVLRDITQWKRTEEELRTAKDQAERANAQKSEFLANISHELRTPLNAIIGFSEVMQTEKFGSISNDRYKGYVNDIHSSGEHLLSLINDLLDLSKVEAGKLELNFTSVDLSDIIQQCIGIIQEQATRERIIIRTSVTERLPNVVADQRSMRQILLNLLSNAVKFTGKGGQVIVSALMDEDGQIKLLVKDTGIGMSSEELVQAMEPFQRVEQTQSPERPGTGLGLPLTKALAEANRAAFEIESEPGRGTRVQITFPTTRVLAD